MDTLEILEDPNGELYIQLPKDLLEKMNWKEGDDLSWIDNKDGSWTLQKTDKTK